MPKKLLQTKSVTSTAAPGLLFGVVYDGVITVAKKSAKERLLVVIVNRKDFPGSRQLHNLGGGDVITLA